MIDMTNGNEKKQSFITNILLDCDGKYYYVVYADGNVEKSAFDIESYNEVLFQMEKEYFAYREEYCKRVSNKRLTDSIKMIATDLITALGIYLTLNVNMEEILKVACIFVVALIGILFHQQFNGMVYMSNCELDEIQLMEEFIKRKEEFAVDIVDSETGEVKKWYAINLSNIYTITSTKSLDKYTKDEYKIKKVPKFLRKKSELQDA